MKCEDLIVEMLEEHKITLITSLVFILCNVVCSKHSH